jgi:hypothetical protein
MLKIASIDVSPTRGVSTSHFIGVMITGDIYSGSASTFFQRGQ